MSSSVTPQRRSRDDDEDEEEDYDETLGDDTSSHGSKRRRVDSEGEDEDESPERPLLPDNYRRSPKGKGRARDVQQPRQQEHAPGSIVRVTLKDFVTYTNAEFLPGPNLNMIIGPNGTGKSTLVCAICIGLGWSTSHLGRAKDISEFVKHGKKQAEIEIELKANPDRHTSNPIITHKINRDGGGRSGQSKSVWLIDGKKSTQKAVQELARSFSIQVDNLCQFLPQDRVNEFAALQPIDLLVHTQRAAAPEHVSQWHDELKSMGKEQKQKQTEQQSLLETLKSMEERQRSQQDEVDRLRERTSLQEKVALLEKMRPFVEYSKVVKEFENSKEREKRAKDELRVLRQNAQPNRNAVNSKRTYLSQVEQVVGTRSRLVTNLDTAAQNKMKDCQTTEEQLKDCEKRLQAERDGVKKAKACLNTIQNQIRDLERAKQNPPARIDTEEMNEQIRQFTTRIREIETEETGIRESLRNMGTQASQRKSIIEDLEGRKTNLQSQAGRQTTKLERTSSQTAKAWKWIQENPQEFEGEVYGPPMVTCSVKDARYADAVEMVIGKSELQAFTVTSQRDFKVLDQKLYRVFNYTDIYIRSSLQPLESFRAPCSNEDLQGLGLQHWLLDFVEGPDAVLAMLCENRNIHQTAFTPNEISDAKDQAIKRSPVSSWITGGTWHTITRRREYGEAGTGSRAQFVRRATLLTDAPVDSQEEQRINREIAEKNGEVEMINQEMQGLSRRNSQLRQESQKLQGEQKALREDKDAKQRQWTEYNALDTKLENMKRKREDAKSQVDAFREFKRNIVKQEDAFSQKRAQQAIDYAKAVEALRKTHVDLFEAEVMKIEATSEVEQLQARMEHEERRLAQKEEELAELTEARRRFVARGRELSDICVPIKRDFSDEEQEYYDEHENAWDSDQLEGDIASAQASLEALLGGGNENVIREFEERAVKIERKRQQFFALQEKLEGLNTKIEEIRAQWEPEVDNIVGQISEAFTENFSRIQCAGEVAVHKDEDFEQWSIQIKVKFRENEQLSVLDNHRQSGGERSVSTIFYLMALQSLARAPFRVVDEINQGMDPRNERLVHSRMVEIACAEHTSQYFLITPKLLNGLRYHPNMKVHCIASGEYMPENFRELDFGMLAKRALEVRAAAVH